MRLRSKRLVSLLLAGSMMVSMVPASAVTAFAAETNNAAVMAADSDVANPVSLSVTVNAGKSLETAVKSAAQSENKSWENITSLTVITAADKELDKADFQFLNTSLSALKELDLTDASCENNAIPEKAFYSSNDSAKIEKIFLPHNLKEIGTSSFSSNLKNPSLKYVGMREAYTDGKAVNFPDTIEKIGFCAFYAAKGLTGTLELPQNRAITLGSAAFQNASVTGSVTIGDNITFDASPKENENYIHRNTFKNTKISAVTVSCKNVPMGVFSDCPLTSITISDGVKTIGERAFFNLKSTSSLAITIPQSVTSIGNYAFCNAKIDNITVPKSVKTIGNYAFGNCITNSITISEGVEAIGTKAFYKINNDNSNSSSNTSELDIAIPGSVKSIGESAFEQGKIKSIKIADGVQTIDTKAFYNLSGNTSLTIVIPESVLSIGASAFASNGRIASAIVENKNAVLGEQCFAWSGNNTGKIYVAAGSARDDIWDEHNIHLIMNGGQIPTDENKNVTGQEDTVTGLYSPVKDGSHFAGWYKDVNDEITKLTSKAVRNNTYYAKWDGPYTLTFDYGEEAAMQEKVVTVPYGTSVNEPKSPAVDGYKFDGWYNGDDKVAFPLTINADTTLTANWISYETKADAEVKVNADPADKTVEIDVTVTVPADTTELDGATATLNFTDANGNDDSANVAEVAVDGKKLDSYKNISIADLMNGGNDAAMVATYAATQSKTAKLTVTYKTPGEHNVEIVLNAANGDVICKQTATVKITPEPGTLNLTACTAKLSDGTEVKNGDKVPVGTDVTVTFDKDFYADSNLVLSGWQVTPDTLTDVNGKLVKDFTADSFTFVMPETENGVTIEAQTKTADTEDDSWDAATIVTGVAVGAGAAVLTYHIGTELYAEQVLGKGVAVPKTREEVALKAWELAGKPAVAMDGEPLSEAAQAEKWAVESGLMQNVDGSFNGQKKMNKLKALRVLDAAKKLNAQ